jgi:bacteriorhodopsin
MPGLLIDANSSKVSASTVTWSIDLNRLYVADAVMTARSRVVNPWAWWITGTAALILVLLVIVRRFAHPR